ncbi:MAG: hydroxyacylglutathione hydrolase [Pseudomonadota bacterium]
MNSLSAQFKIELLPCLKDNYAFFLIDTSKKEAYVIDTPDGQKIADWCRDHNIHLRGILNTHHHHDHTGGNTLLKTKYDCEIHGLASDDHRIPNITLRHHPGETVPLFDGKLTAEIIPLDGHTLGSTGYYIKDLKALFLGDTVFNLGCGYLFEGTYEDMWHSMQRVKALPEETYIYCAHEYTLNNATFVKHYFPDINGLDAYIDKMKSLRAKDAYTVPTLLKDQLKFNPFLCADQEHVKSATQTIGKPDIESFKTLRELKNNF